MKKTIRKILCLALSTSVVLSCVTATAFAADNTVGVTYSAHVQNNGWMAGASNGQTAGTTGQALRVEALKIALTGSNLPANAGIAYQVHVQDKGWVTPASQNGSVAGTVGESKRIEAIAIALSNMPGYSVEYRVHVQNIGWMNWTKDGNITGTTGKGLRIEAIEIKVVSNIAVNSISVTPALQLVAGGNNGTITATIDPSSVSADSINWSSNNTAVATVSKGIVTPVSGGSATITASVGGKSAACIVTVSAGGGYAAPVAVTGLSVSPTVTSLFAGGPTSTIIPAILPVDATNKSITWSSDNTNVATVAGGVITPVSAGTATITATSADNTKLSATTEVTVTATPTVYTLADLTAAIQSTGVTSITLGGNIAGNAVAAHTGTTNFIINFGSYTLTGNLNITANSVTAITFNGDAGNRIIGNLTITAPLASVTNNVAITGSATLNGVALHSYIANETHGGGIIMNGQGRLNLSGDASGSAITIDTSAPVTLAGTISGTVTIAAPGAQVTVEGTAGSMILSSTAPGSSITVAGTGSLTSFTANTSGTLTTETGGTVTGTATGTGVTETNPSAGVKVYTTALSSIAIKTPASKTVYAVGETLDITGLTIEGTYSDGSKKDEVITAANVTGFNSTAIATDQVLTVTVDGKTVTYKVQIATSAASDFTYTVASGKATITGYTGAGGVVVIPNTLGGYPVTSIGGYAFRNCSTITGLSIPLGVTTIGGSAFAACSLLTTISIPDGVTSIGVCAFINCNKLTNIYIPGSVTAIGELSFEGCYMLTDISVAADNLSYNSIDGVLYNKSGTILIACPAGISTITIPQEVSEIAAFAFDGCSLITSLSLSSNITTIGQGAFQLCSGLLQIGVSSNNTHFSSLDGVLFNKNQSTLIAYPGGKTGNYVIPDGVTTLSQNAFYGCIGLTDVTLDNDLTSINGLQFAYSHLSSMIVSSSVTAIGDMVFYGASGMSSITFNSPTTSIGDAARTIPTSAKIIGYSTSTAKDYATKYGRTFEAIVAPVTLTAIAVKTPADKLIYAVGDSLDITGLTIEGTYSDTSKKTELITAANVTGFNSSAQATDQVLTVTVDGKTVTYKIQIAIVAQESDFTYTVSTGEAEIIAYKGTGGIVIIPSTLGGDPVTSIGAFAFRMKSTITSISIPQGVRTIGNQAFEYCVNLTNISIPDSVTSIGSSSMDECSKLQSIVVASNNSIYKSVNGALYNKVGTTLLVCPAGLALFVIPQEVTDIGYRAFASCTQLTSISIPQGVISIPSYPFTECSALTQINVDSSNTLYSSVGGVLFNKDKSVLIAYPAAKTGSYIIPATVTSLDGGAFTGCIGLSGVTIPEGMLIIGWSAFSMCTALTSVTLPTSVTSIGNQAFYGCSALTSIRFNLSTTTIYDDANTIPSTTKIIGYSTSTAKDYATKYSRTFEVIS